jgi:hypothetical protein
MFLRPRPFADVLEYFRRMRDFDYFIRRLIEGKACKSPIGFRHYDAMYRAVCLGETKDLDADPGPYYPFILVAHYFWRRGDVYRACVFLEKARGKQLLHYDEDEKTAAVLLEAAIREGIEGVRRIKTEDTHLSWASLFKDLLIAELDPAARAEAIQRIRHALKLVEEETADLTEEIIEHYNMIPPPKMPYAYISYAVEELERRELAPRRNMKDILLRILRPGKRGVKLPTRGSSPLCTQLRCLCPNQ